MKKKHNTNYWFDFMFQPKIFLESANTDSHTDELLDNPDVGRLFLGG